MIRMFAIQIIRVMAFSLFASTAFAQGIGTVPNHAIPIGKGPGVSGFGSAAPGTSAFCLTSNGASADPTFQVCPLPTANIIANSLQLNGVNHDPSLLVFSDVNYTSAISHGIILAQTLTGTNAASSNPNFFGINSDNTNTPGLTGWAFGHAFGGSNMSGHRFTFEINSTFTAPDDGTTVNPFYVTFTPTMTVAANNHGTALAPRGNYVVGNPAVHSLPAATYIANLNTYEFDLTCEAPCASLQNKVIVTLAEIGPDAGHGGIMDAMLQFTSNDDTNVGFNNVICVCAGSGGAVPFHSGSTIFKLETAHGRTIDNFIDVRGVTMNAFLYGPNGFVVDGVGQVAAMGYFINGVTGATCAAGTLNPVTAVVDHGIIISC